MTLLQGLREIMCVKHSIQGLDYRKFSIEGLGVVGRQEIVQGREKFPSACRTYVLSWGPVNQPGKRQTTKKNKHKFIHVVTSAGAHPVTSNHCRI